ncbi:MAG: RNA pseudouridine synthase [Spirochaetaceae bacterium]|nr:MAG: RNA pseudouridine synthase [Spirochaetaceae bacterium]
MPVENDPSQTPSLFDAVRYRLAGQQVICDRGRFLGVVHRIDQPVAGLVLFARSAEALRRLHRLFRERAVDKRYWAVVEGDLPQESGTLEHHLSNDRRTNRATAHQLPGSDRKRARLDYVVAGRSRRYTLVEIRLHTGRHHQIRAQLAAAGAPIKGDLKYGARRSNPGGGIYLFARALRFTHPMTGRPLELIAEPPPDVLWDLFPRPAAPCSFGNDDRN